MIATDIANTVKTLLQYGHGTLRKKDGTEVSGAVIDIQSPINDPDGIGYITLMQENGKAVDIYQTQFAGLVEAW